MNASAKRRRLQPGMRALLCCFALAAFSSAALAADVFHGETVYRMYCVSCHGPRGVAVMPGAPDLSRGESLVQPDRNLLMTLRSGKNAMPAYFGILNDRDLLDVIAFTRTLMR